MKPDYDRAARMAYKTLLALHIESFPIDPLMILSFCKNTIVRSYEELVFRFGNYDYYTFKTCVMDGKEAMTLRRVLDNGTVCYELFYGNHGNPFRRRFTLAHELGHIILKHSMEQSWEEVEANYFASQLLAPHPIISAMANATPESISSLCCLSRTASVNALAKPRHQQDQELYNLLKHQMKVIA